MTTPLFVGIDPGQTTGICAFVSPHAPVVMQINAKPVFVVGIVRALIEHDVGGEGATLAVEQFVVLHRAARSSTARAGAIAREIIAVLQSLAREIDATLHLRPAAAVKPWASDWRLELAGLLEPTQHMTHARDAARHALYAAVHDGYVIDPLSSRASAR